MSTHVEHTPGAGITPYTRHEDLVLQVICCVLATLGSQTRMYQWLSQGATVQQGKASKGVAKSYRSIVPLVMSASIGVLGAASIASIFVSSLSVLEKPFGIAQNVISQGQTTFGNFAQGDRTELQAASERAQMFYQKFSREEANADSERSRLVQSIAEFVRGQLEAMRSMSR